MDTSRLKFPKGTPRKEAKAARVKARVSIDRLESAKVKERSGGRCEVVVKYRGMEPYRCGHRAAHVHHMIGGRGRRGVGISALSIYQQHVCVRCHQDIGGKIGGKKLLRVGGYVPFWTDQYRRVK